MAFTQNVARDLFDITPSANALTKPAHALLVTVDGDLSITTSAGTTPSTFAVVAGQEIKVQVTHVLAATTATVKGYTA